MSATSRLLAGIGFSVAAVACFAALDTTTKFVTTGVPLLMALWFRYVIQAVATTAAVWPGRGRHVLRTDHPWLQCTRGLMLFLSSLFAFLSLKHMPVGEFTAIVMLTPLVITVLAALLLGDRVSSWRWLLVVGGFSGTLVIIRPGGADFNWTLLFPLGLVAANSAFQILTSRLARTEDAFTMQMYTGWVGTLLASLALPLVWSTPTSLILWGGLVFMGISASVGHYLLILAYARAPAATLTPYLYAQIGFAMLGGWLVFGHLPDGWSLVGMAMVAACGVAGAWLTVLESRVRATGTRIAA